MTETNDEQPAKKGKVTHALPEILKNGPVILFGYRRPPGPVPEVVETGPTAPAPTTADENADPSPNGIQTTKKRIPIIEATDGKAYAFLQTGRPLPPEADHETGS